MTSPIVVTGQVSLAGMPPLITAQVLYGLQQRTRSGAHTRIEVLRTVVEELRRSQADTVDALADRPPEGMGKEKRTVLWALARHARLALADPESECVKDVWELVVFGLGGRLTFTRICQPWLREATKRWAADELPQRRGSGAGTVMRKACAPTAPTTAMIPPRWGAPTSNRSYTASPTWPRPASAAWNSAPGFAGTSSASSAGSGHWD
jgi:hypothetical protein